MFDLIFSWVTQLGGEELEFVRLCCGLAEISFNWNTHFIDKETEAQS